MKLDLTRCTLFQTVIYFCVLLAIFFARNNYLQIDYDSLQISRFGITELGCSLIDWVESVPNMGAVVSLFLLSINAFFLTRIVVRFVVFLSRNYLPALIFLLFCSLDGSTNNQYFGQLVLFLLLVATEMAFLVYKRANSVGNLFSSALYIGLASLLFLPAVFMLPVLCVYMISFRKFTPRNLVVILAGVVAPIFFYCYVSWCCGANFLEPLQYNKQLFYDSFMRKSLNIYLFSISDWVFISITLLLVLFSLVLYVYSILYINPMTVLMFAFFMWMLLFGIAVMVFFYNCTGAFMPLVFAPLSVIIAIMFKQVTSIRMRNYLVVIFLLSAITIGLY